MQKKNNCRPRQKAKQLWKKVKGMNMYSVLMKLEALIKTAGILMWKTLKAFAGTSKEIKVSFLSMCGFLRAEYWMYSSVVGHSTKTAIALNMRVHTPAVPVNL